MSAIFQKIFSDAQENFCISIKKFHYVVCFQVPIDNLSALV